MQEMQDGYDGLCIKGRMFTKLQESDVQAQADVIKELTKAIIRVAKNPQH
jgi:phenylpyruvate tautomerase PptA (4-oxalocrotonate tautomerase family)